MQSSDCRTHRMQVFIKQHPQGIAQQPPKTARIS
jgi:hypothetical protein